MQFHQLRTFLAVGDTLNMSRAAERLHLAQSSVSEQVRMLEDSLGAELFDRRSRRLALTSVGEILLPHARRILECVEDAKASVAASAATVSGTLRIGTLETIASRFLPPHLLMFREHYPSVALSVHVTSSGAALADLRSGNIDFAVVFDEPPQAEGLKALKLADEPIVGAFPKGSDFDCKHCTLDQFDLIATPEGCIYRALLDRVRGSQSVAIEVDSLATVLTLVRAGKGLAVLPQLAIDGAEVDTMPWQDGRSSVAICLVWRHRHGKTPSANAFRDMLMDAVKPSDDRRPHVAPCPL